MTSNINVFLYEINNYIMEWKSKHGNVWILKIPLDQRRPKPLDEKTTEYCALREMTLSERASAESLMNLGWWKAVYSYVIDHCVLYPKPTKDIVYPVGISYLAMDLGISLDYDEINMRATAIAENREIMSSSETIGYFSGLLGLTPQETSDLYIDQVAGMYSSVIKVKQQRRSSRQPNQETLDIAQRAATVGSKFGADSVEDIIANAKLGAEDIKAELDRAKRDIAAGRQPNVRKPNFLKDGVIIKNA